MSDVFKLWMVKECYAILWLRNKQICHQSLIDFQTFCQPFSQMASLTCKLSNFLIIKMATKLNPPPLPHLHLAEETRLVKAHINQLCKVRISKHWRRAFRNAADWFVINWTEFLGLLSFTERNFSWPEIPSELSHSTTESTPKDDTCSGKTNHRTVG